MSSFVLRNVRSIAFACLFSHSTISGRLLAQSSLDSATQTAVVPRTLDDAMEAYERVLAEHPDDRNASDGEVDAASKAALSFRTQGQMNEALAALLRAKKSVPANATLLFDIGILENQMHLNQDASMALQASLQLRPQDPITLYGLARVRMDLGEYPQAESAMRAYLEQRPDDVSAHYGLGRILVISLKDEEALVEFERSIRLQPSQTESYFEVGEIELRAGHPEKAEAGYENCLSRDAKHGGALTGMGILAYRRKQFRVAGGYLDKAVEAAPAYQTAHYYRGLVLARLGQKQQADAELATAARLTAEDDRKRREQLKLLSQ